MQITVVQGESLSELTSNEDVKRGDFIALHFNRDLSTKELKPMGLNLHGATSCLGAMTQAGPSDGYSAFVIRDPDGAYGTGMRSFSLGAQDAGEAAVKAALVQADRLGEIPDLVWISATPGSEEQVLEGVQSVVGRQTPIIGGSAADNDVTGKWFVFDGRTEEINGVIVSVLFSSRPISFAYQNGYSPTQNTGTVTKTAGRAILEIDNQPASRVYNEWTNGAVAVASETQDSVSILSESTMWPLGRKISSIGDVPFYLSAHPAVSTSDGALHMFATVSEGEELTSLVGTKKGLIDRAGRVAALSCAAGNFQKTDISGALMIYCGGCMLAVREDLPNVVAGVNDALGGAPFLGAFTFGEQGPLLGAGNRHGNLMISCVVFG